MENLFSYGTLQLSKIQEQLFNRLLEGQEDVLVGYKKELIRISVDPTINSSGSEEHSIISYTGNSSDLIEGVVYAVTNDELRRADDYETADYKRVLVTLKSGRTSWVYIKPGNN